MVLEADIAAKVDERAVRSNVAVAILERRREGQANEIVGQEQLLIREGRIVEPALKRVVDLLILGQRDLALMAGGVADADREDAPSVAAVEPVMTPFASM